MKIKKGKKVIIRSSHRFHTNTTILILIFLKIAEISSRLYAKVESFLSLSIYGNFKNKSDKLTYFRNINILIHHVAKCLVVMMVM
jgi:hypothetical protein